MGNIVRLFCASLLLLSAWDSRAPQFSGGGQEAKERSQQAGLQPAGWVTDAANVLKDGEEERITQQLQQLERKTGHQMVVVTVPTLEGQTIEEYTRSLANRWGVGRREYNDGAVVLVAPNERKVRIGVGLGLEHVVTNDFASQIIQTVMIPKFREGDYFGGVGAGVSTLKERLSKR
jgi:uncharacterized protein